MMNGCEPRPRLDGIHVVATALLAGASCKHLPPNRLGFLIPRGFAESGISQKAIVLPRRGTFRRFNYGKLQVERRRALCEFPEAAVYSYSLPPTSLVH